MQVNKALINDVKAHLVIATNVGPFSPGVVSKLTNAQGEFMLATDEYIDVGRLPNNVISLDTLFNYLRAIQQKLANRDNKVKNEDWDVAKSGELKLYKLYVCAIHALSAYLKDTPDFTVPVSVFATAVVSHARTHVPPNLAKNGATLWGKTFDVGQARTMVVMVSLLFFCSKEAGTSTTVPTPPATAPAPQLSVPSAPAPAVAVQTPVITVPTPPTTPPPNSTAVPDPVSTTQTTATTTQTKSGISGWMGQIKSTTAAAPGPADA